ncbi:lysine N(6)-hydroxylase/L-ornithine N(5)-oxygenase family protein [Rhodococcus sp. NPDC060176]|uniref:lysine N(6)-hydroxylase/L-ornithine N(5)-oxygenase family protein n=1 Tax=Rhodococcus sp. NPDC060176 TaxID=3347062 RepID=UPI003653676C
MTLEMIELMCASKVDLLGVGVGPFNLSLAALADGLDLTTQFVDRKQEFSWHPGMLIGGSKLQVPFLADLVTMVCPTSRWSYLNYLSEHQRLFQFFFSERFEVPRREYSHYLEWVSSELESCRFGCEVVDISWVGAEEAFVANVRYSDGGVDTVVAKNIVLGIGSRPVATPQKNDAASPEGESLIFHSGEYLEKRSELLSCERVAVIGGGQSGAEIVLDLIRAQDWEGRLASRPIWISRSTAFAPMEYSKLGLQHFTPDYVEYFFRLSDDVKQELLAKQWQLYKAVSNQTLSDIHDELYERTIGGREPNAELRPGVEVRTVSEGKTRRYSLLCWHVDKRKQICIEVDAVVWANGYESRPPTVLDAMKDSLPLDSRGKLIIRRDYSISTTGDIGGKIYVQNGEMHTHGIGAPDLTLGAWRSAQILNSIIGEARLPVAGDVAWTRFG